MKGYVKGPKERNLDPAALCFKQMEFQSSDLSLSRPKCMLSLDWLVRKRWGFWVCGFWGFVLKIGAHFTAIQTKSPLLRFDNNKMIVSPVFPKQAAVSACFPTFSK